MAEVVEYRLGKTFEEIDVLIKFGLLDESQAKEIVKKREEHEYALRRRTNDKLTFLKFIKFEMNLLASIEQYQKTIAKKTNEDKIFELQAKKLTHIIKSRVAHINFLFRKLIMKNQFDVRLWLVFIEFAKQRRSLSRASALYWRMLRVVNAKESLWIEAADFEINMTKDLNTARKILLLGLRHNPKSTLMKQKLSQICEGQPTLADQQNTKDQQDTVDQSNIGDQQSTPGQSKKSGGDKTLSLYVRMIEDETWKLTKDNSDSQLDKIRNIYEDALRKYGQQKPKLWYEYLRFEYKHATSLEHIERTNRIYSRALATLDSSKVNRVIEKYSLLQLKLAEDEYSDYSDLDDS